MAGALQPGADTTVNITIGTPAVMINQNLALPGAADGINLNFHLLGRPTERVCE
ncbi:MAG: hypothetical protein WDN31_06520 [Hyphomicrobium sp.]